MRRLLPALVFAITFVVFLPALDAEFLNWDDTVALLDNGSFRGLGASQVTWMFSTTLMGHYMPLTWLTYGLNYVVNGMNPLGYHLGNLLLHALNAALFYLVAVRLLEAAALRARDAAVTAGAVLAALLFGVHPQRAESVGWITDRATALSAMLYLLAVLGYLRATAGGGRLRWKWAGLASLLAFGAALLSKGIVMSLPISLLILDVYPLRRRVLGWPRLLTEKIPYAAIAITGAIVALVARTQGAQLSQYDIYDLNARLALAAYSLWFYPSRLLWPNSLSPLYEHPIHAGILEGRFLGPALAVLTATVVLFLARRRFPGGLAAWVHSAVVVGPVSGIVHSGSQIVSDRYGYLAGLGVVTVIGYGLVWTLDAYRRRRLRRLVAATMVGGAVLVVLVLALTAWIQTYLWHDSETLWRWAVDRDPACALCQAALGSAILQAPGGAAERMGEAERHLREATALRRRLALPYADLGTIETTRGHDAEAELAFRTYIELAPRAPDGPERLAVFLLIRDRPGEAIGLLRQAQEMRRTAAAAPPAVALPAAVPPDTGERGRRQALKPEFLEAVGLLGQDLASLQYLGQVLVQRGRPAEAIESLRRAVALAPTAPVPRFWLVRALALGGDAEGAEREIAALRALDPVIAEMARAQGAR